MLGFTQPTNYNIGMCEVQILPINNQYKVRNIKFQGQVTKNPILDNCLASRLGKTQQLFTF